MPLPTLTAHKRGSAWFVALFFLALTALGIFTSGDYGQPWDEPWEQDILRMNLNQYAYFLGTGLSLPYQSDIPGPESRLIADCVERDHGESAYYPVYWLVTDTSLAPLQRMTLWHAYTWLLFMAGAAALWLIARRLGLSRLLSSVVVLFLVLSPRMFADGHYNNKDIVLLSLTLLTLWLALRTMEKPTAWRALCFSLAGAMAANTKIIGLMVWGLCALFILARQLAGRRMTGRAWLAAGVALVSFAAFYALLTPALWADPLGYLRYVIITAADFTRWEHYVLFRGTIYFLKNTALPWFYLPYFIAVTTPLWVLFFLLVGQAGAVGRLLRRHGKPFQNDTAMTLLLCTLLWLAPLGYAMLGRPTMYNGWRHFYFLYGPMLALAAYGLKLLADRLRAMRAPYLRRALAALLALCMGFTGALMGASHAKQYTYYNVLVPRQNLPAYLELDYWNVATLETVRALLATLPADAEKAPSICGCDYWSDYGLQAALNLLPEDQRARLRLIPSGSKGANYTLANRTYAVLGHWQPASNQTVAVETLSYGVPICTIYQRKTN